MPEILNMTDNTPLSLTLLALNLCIGLLLSLALKWHFQKFGSTLSNRAEFAQVFPFILLTTVLIITVVKSSLALSLGLVGALSIVRFRTPIKEPEELAYLFLAIAMGLGLGANQTIPTVLSGLGILTAMGFINFKGTKERGKNLFLSIDWNLSSDAEQNALLKFVHEIISKSTNNNDLRRIDIRGGSVEATYLIDVNNINDLEKILNDLRSEIPNIGITFLDQNHIPST